MPLYFELYGVAALLTLAVLAVPASIAAVGRRALYGATLTVCLVALAADAFAMATRFTATAVLPLGLPWIGMNLRLDPLASYFLVVINLGSAAASLYAIGYDRHESAPWRVAPFFPAFLAGMNMVVMAADAFTFLFSWEFMSLASWALVMAHHPSGATRTPASSIS